MRVIIFANNWVGWQITEWLASQENIVGLVIHPEQRSSYRSEIIKSSGVSIEHIVEADSLSESSAIETMTRWQPEIGVSGLFGYLLKPQTLSLIPRGCVNIHPALLPFNRGAHPNVWSIVDRTPAGATLHYVDEGVDTGEIIAQQEILKEIVDTGETLYRKLEMACVELFKCQWPNIRSGSTSRVRQNDIGTSHKIRDVESIDEIDLDQQYEARQLIDIIRARTFPPYRGAYIREGGKKIFLRLNLTYETDLNEQK